MALQKKTTHTENEMTLISYLLFTKFFQNSIMIIIINLYIHKNYELFQNGGLIHDLIMIGIGRFFFEFIILFIFDFNFYYKRLKNYFLTKKIKNNPYNNKISQYEYNKSFEGYTEVLSVRFVRILLPISNAFFFQIICPFFYCISFIHILFGCFMTRWSLLYRTKKSKNIMGSKYSKRIIRLISYIFILQGFGLLYFDFIFEDLEIMTFVIFIFSLVQLIDIKKLWKVIQQKIKEMKTKKKLKSKRVIPDRNNPLFESQKSGNYFINEDSSLYLDNHQVFKRDTKSPIDMINDKDTMFEKIDIFFITDYDRENPLTKHGSIQEHQMKVTAAKINSQKNIENFTQKNLLRNLQMSISRKLESVQNDHSSVNPTKSRIWKNIFTEEEIPQANDTKKATSNYQTQFSKINFKDNNLDVEKNNTPISLNNIPSSNNLTKNLDTPCIFNN